MFELIINRIAVSLNCNQTQLAEKMGVKQNTFAMWKKRERLPYQEIITLANENGLSLDYIFFGKVDNTQEDSDEKVQNNNPDFSVLLDFSLALGGYENTKNYLREKLIEVVAQKFQTENLGFYKALEKLFSIIDSNSNGFEARPILFLYYVLHQINNEEESPKKRLIEAIKKTKFSRWVFGPEFLPKKVQSIIDYVQTIMSDEEAQVLIQNKTLMLSTLEKTMPLSMMVTHKKYLQKQAIEHKK